MSKRTLEQAHRNNQAYWRGYSGLPDPAVSNFQELYAQNKGAEDRTKQAEQISDAFNNSSGIPPIILLPLLLIGFIVGFAVLVAYFGSNIGSTRSGNFPDATNIPEQDLNLFSHTCTNAHFVRLETALRGDQKILAHIQAGKRFGLIESHPTSLPTGLRINDPVKVAVKKMGWSIFPTDHKYAGWSILPNSSGYIKGYLDRSVITA